MSDSLLSDAARRAQHFLTGLESRAPFPDDAALQALETLREQPLPEQPVDPHAVLAMIDELGSPATVANAGGRYFGFVIGGTLPGALAANWLASAWDQNAGLEKCTPVGAALEQGALRGLLDLLGLPEDAAGAFVTGTSMAHVTALAAARHALLARLGWDVNQQGLSGAPPLTVIASAGAHSSVVKAVRLLGIGEARLLSVPVDEQGRMDVAQFPPSDGPTIICAQAGCVNSGAFDPIDALADIAAERGAWLHVDGAFGLWAAVSDSLRPLLEGYLRADSWATDLHKWLNVPYDSGIAIVRDASQLRGAMSLSADYLTEQEEHREPFHYTPELSRRARGVEVWAALQCLGRQGVTDLVERCCRYARRFADGLAAAGCEVLNDVELNQVLVAFGDDERTRRIINAIQQDGTCWCSDTRWQGRLAMRISVVSWRTSSEDVERSLDAMLRCVAQYQ